MLPQAKSKSQGRLSSGHLERVLIIWSPVVTALSLMTMSLSEFWVSFSSPAEGPGLAQSAPAGLWRVLASAEWGRVRLTRVRTLASDGARVSPATILSLRLSRQPHLVCDLALTCYHPRQLCDYCQVRVRRHGGVIEPWKWIIFIQWESIKQWFWIKFRKLSTKINQRRYQQRQLCK